MSFWDNTFGQFVQITGGIALLLGAIAFAYRTWKETTSKVDGETIDRLKDAIVSLKEENSILRTANAALLLKSADQDKAIAKAQADIQVLQGLVTGKDMLDKLGIKLDTLDSNLLDGNAKIAQQLDKISQGLNSLTKSKQG
ncbi:MAG: hypothetical protein H0U60_19950 [Blastocatellia bacterium]|nr:hypothetical protein [Blastocatellia bacterium]